MILIIYFICFLNLNQDDWKTYYADKKVEISLNPSFVTIEKMVLLLNIT